MKIIYIVSSPRSGSTLLSLLLGKHPLVANLGEVWFIPKHLALKELCTCGIPLFRCDKWADVFDLLHTRTGVDLRASPYGLYLGEVIKRGGRLVDHTYQTPWRVLQAAAHEAADKVVFGLSARFRTARCTLPWIRKSLKNTLLLYETAAQSWSKQLVVDASKRCRVGVHLYRHLPESVRIIHLVRDGRGVAASRLKQMPVKQAAAHWSRYHAYTVKLLGQWVAPEHRKLLRYEDLAASPEAHLRAICEWLDIPFSDQMLSFDKTQIIHSAGGNAARFNILSGISRPDQRWRSLLSTQDLDVFERAAGKLNRQLGFQ
ncbi:MAG: sulfotransferase family protein [Chromatiales bacterium]